MLNVRLEIRRLWYGAAGIAHTPPPEAEYSPAMDEEPQPTVDDDVPQPNLARLAGAGLWLRDGALAVLSGVLLSLAFTPLEWWVLAWAGLAPLLLTPVPAPLWRRLLNGYLCGLGFFLCNLWWLNTIGFAAGVLLAGVCALFPML